MNAFDAPDGFAGQWRALLDADALDGTADGAPIRVTTIDSPLGPLVAGSTRSAVCLLEFADPVRLDLQLRALRRAFGMRVGEGEFPIAARLREELSAYFAGELPRFTVPLEHPGTDFQVREWRALQEIPCGERWTYERMAAHVGRPAAVRAVGAANGRNRLAILVPCHRLVGRGGKLTGYGGGLERKRWLLEHEKRMVSEVVTLDAA